MTQAADDGRTKGASSVRGSFLRAGDDSWDEDDASSGTTDELCDQSLDGLLDQPVEHLGPSVNDLCPFVDDESELSPGFHNNSLKQKPFKLILKRTRLPAALRRDLRKRFKLQEPPSTTRVSEPRVGKPRSSLFIFANALIPLTQGKVSEKEEGNKDKADVTCNDGDHMTRKFTALEKENEGQTPEPVSDQTPDVSTDIPKKANNDKLFGQLIKTLNKIDVKLAYSVCPSSDSTVDKENVKQVQGKVNESHTQGIGREENDELFCQLMDNLCKIDEVNKSDQIETSLDHHSEASSPTSELMSRSVNKRKNRPILSSFLRRSSHKRNRFEYERLTRFKQPLGSSSKCKKLRKSPSQKKLQKTAFQIPPDVKEVPSVDDKLEGTQGCCECDTILLDNAVKDDTVQIQSPNSKDAEEIGPIFEFEGSVRDPDSDETSYSDNDVEMEELDATPGEANRVPDLVDLTREPEEPASLWDNIPVVDLTKVKESAHQTEDKATEDTSSKDKSLVINNSFNLLKNKILGSGVSDAHSKPPPRGKRKSLAPAMNMTPHQSIKFINQMHNNRPHIITEYCIKKPRYAIPEKSAECSCDDIGVGMMLMNSHIRSQIWPLRICETLLNTALVNCPVKCPSVCYACREEGPKGVPPHQQFLLDSCFVYSFAFLKPYKIINVEESRVKQRMLSVPLVRYNVLTKLKGRNPFFSCYGQCGVGCAFKAASVAGLRKHIKQVTISTALSVNLHQKVINSEYFLHDEFLNNYKKTNPKNNASISNDIAITNGNKPKELAPSTIDQDKLTSRDHEQTSKEKEQTSKDQEQTSKYQEQTSKYQEQTSRGHQETSRDHNDQVLNVQLHDGQALLILAPSTIDQDKPTLTSKDHEQTSKDQEQTSRVHQETSRDHQVLDVQDGQALISPNKRSALTLKNGHISKGNFGNDLVDLLQTVADKVPAIDLGSGEEPQLQSNNSPNKMTRSPTEENTQNVTPKENPQKENTQKENPQNVTEAPSAHDHGTKQNQLILGLVETLQTNRPNDLIDILIRCFYNALSCEKCWNASKLEEYLPSHIWKRDAKMDKETNTEDPCKPSTSTSNGPYKWSSRMNTEPQPISKTTTKPQPIYPHDKINKAIRSEETRKRPQNPVKRSPLAESRICLSGGVSGSVSETLPGTTPDKQILVVKPTIKGHTYASRSSRRETIPGNVATPPHASVNLQSRRHGTNRHGTADYKLVYNVSDHLITRQCRIWDIPDEPQRSQRPLDHRDFVQAERVVAHIKKHGTAEDYDPYSDQYTVQYEQVAQKPSSITTQSQPPNEPSTSRQLDEIQPKSAPRVGAPKNKMPSTRGAPYSVLKRDINANGNPVLIVGRVNNTTTDAGQSASSTEQDTTQQSVESAEQNVESAQPAQRDKEEALLMSPADMAMEINDLLREIQLPNTSAYDMIHHQKMVDKVRKSQFKRNREAVKNVGSRIGKQIQAINENMDNMNMVENDIVTVTANEGSSLAELQKMMAQPDFFLSPNKKKTEEYHVPHNELVTEPFPFGDTDPVPPAPGPSTPAVIDLTCSPAKTSSSNQMDSSHLKSFFHNSSNSLPIPSPRQNPPTPPRKPVNVVGNRRSKTVNMGLKTASHAIKNHVIKKHSELMKVKPSLSLDRTKPLSLRYKVPEDDSWDYFITVNTQDMATYIPKHLIAGEYSDIVSNIADNLLIMPDEIRSVLNTRAEAKLSPGEGGGNVFSGLLEKGDSLKVQKRVRYEASDCSKLLVEEHLRHLVNVINVFTKFPITKSCGGPPVVDCVRVVKAFLSKSESLCYILSNGICGVLDKHKTSLARNGAYFHVDYKGTKKANPRDPSHNIDTLKLVLTRMREDHKGVVTERNEEESEEEDLEKIDYVKYWYRDDNAVFSMFLMSNGSLQVNFHDSYSSVVLSLSDDFICHVTQDEMTELGFLSSSVLSSELIIKLQFIGNVALARVLTSDLRMK